MTFGQLPADDYRIYIPNQIEPGNVDTQIDDIYGNPTASSRRVVPFLCAVLAILAALS